jgi:ankyrin repeat protein
MRIQGLCVAACSVALMVSAQVSDTRVANAAQRDDIAAVRSLLAEKADVNGAQGDGSTALHWAAFKGDVALVNVLLKAGANLKATTRIDGVTPLFMACKGGSAPVVDAMLKNGADANETNSNGTTALMIASAAGSADVVKLLLDRGADPNRLDKTNGQTALMFAAWLNRAPVIKVLLLHGADPKVTTKVEKLTRVLVDANGDPIPPPGQRTENAGKAEVGLGAAGTAPAAPAEAAAAARNRAAARDRVFGAQVMGGMTALHFAARDGQMDAVQELVADGAGVNEVSASTQTSPMVEALINAHFDVAKYLLEHGADPKLQNADGLTALYAVEDMQWRSNTWYPQPTAAEEKTNYLDLMKELVAKGADINARMTRVLWYRKFRYGSDWADVAGATTFWRAAQANDVAGMKLLVSLGADPNLPSKHLVTPLMVASGVGFEYQYTNLVPDSRMAAVTYLIEELHANVNAKDDKGYTALHGLGYVGDNDVILYLVSKGADPKIRANARLGSTQGAEDVAPGEGDSTADMANGPREKSLLHPETVALFEKLGSYNSHNCRSTGCVNPTKPDKPKPATTGATASEKPGR